MYSRIYIKNIKISCSKSKITYKMNEEDKKRFARYYPGYVEPPENVEEDIQNADNQSENNTEKKNILGYIDKIAIDKDKLIINTISNK